MNVFHKLTYIVISLLGKNTNTSRNGSASLLRYDYLGELRGCRHGLGHGCRVVLALIFSLAARVTRSALSHGAQRDAASGRPDLKL